MEALSEGLLPRRQPRRDLPFLGLEPGWRVPGDEEEGSHGVHVTQSWRTEETQSAPPARPRACSPPHHRPPATHLLPIALSGPSLLSQAPHLRGAPSAISMAVIPKDQMSLCGGKRRGTGERSRPLFLVHALREAPVLQPALSSNSPNLPIRTFLTTKRSSTSHC